MMFTAPLVLLGLLALPGIWLLLRLNPPRPRRIRFPPLPLLRDLSGEQRTPHTVPIWILLLRMVAVLLLVVGLAGPLLHPPPALPGRGPVLLVIDNGWASAADWPPRIAAANRVAAAARAADRGVSILTTAPGADGAPPRVQGVMTAAAAAQVIAALQPWPWPVDRRGAAAILQSRPAATRVYLADGVGGPDFAAFMRALRPDRIIAADRLPTLLAPPLLLAGGGLDAQLISGPPTADVLAEDAAGNVLARAPFDRLHHAVINLPLPLANKIAFLRVAGVPTAGGTALLDGSSQAVLTGLVAAGGNAVTPFLGPLYFIRRALPRDAAILTDTLMNLIAAKAEYIILADTPLDPPQLRAAMGFVTAGGVLLRFAGPLTAASPDPLSPDPLLPGDRRLGGSLSWTTPLSLAPFPPASPLAGLPAGADATVTRQMLADPGSLDTATVWASLRDGTPIILGQRLGRGYLVSVLTTANLDWSSLAISGLYPALLARLAALSHGGTPPPHRVLRARALLSAFGALSPATGGAGITPAGIANVTISPAAPPGLYGDGAAALALNLGGHVPAPERALLPGAAPLTGAALPVGFGGPLIATALLLLAVDLAVSLLLRGLLLRRVLRWGGVALTVCLLIPGRAHAQAPALQTELGYIRTGDPATDQISADGLAYISADATAHSSALLGDAVGLNPATDDLGLYPLIYWLVLPNAPAPPPAACDALVTYMGHGGLLVIDTPGGDAGGAGSGAGFAPNAGAALIRATACLDLPPLSRLTTADTVAHCFYIVPDFSGRFTGAPVLIATATARDADGVTPVIIGQNDWAAAWARDALGNTEQMPIPGGDGQRIIADRFGTNLVIYALTGNYKADQMSAPALLDKLGQ